MREGRSPSIPEVAEEALVSVPTAYRYFSTPQQLWAEVTVNLAEPDPNEVFSDVGEDDAEARVEALVDAVSGMQLEDEALWRNVVRVSLERWFEQAKLPEPKRVPVRGERRQHWIEHALKPVAEQFDESSFRRLSTALALAFGVEAMITLRDGCGLDANEAKETMLWTARAVVAAARRDASTAAKANNSTN